MGTTGTGGRRAAGRGDLEHRILGARVGTRALAGVASLVAAGALLCAACATPAGASTPAQGAASASQPPSSASALASLPANYQAYWLATTRGQVYAAGGAKSDGTLAGRSLAKPVVGMAATPTGGGYWLVAADGGIFTFGDARFFGSTGAMHLNAPVVGMAATPTGGGYWLVAADGGVFTFGDARFFGSTGATRLAAPIVGMSAMPTGDGYRLVGADGGVFDFGSATFYGSLGGRPRPYPITAMTAMFSDKGYWLTTSQGGVQNFGAAQLYGRTPVLDGEVVAMAPAEGNGDPPPPGYPSGSYGYDVSNYQCGNFPQGAHTIGVVEIDGWGDSYTNPCFITEVDWAGPGVNLYMFMVYGTSSTPAPGCSGAPVPAACDFGYATAASDFATASGMINGRATVPWWLDIEQGNWSPDKPANASVVMGAIDALHAEGVATVGFYFSLEGWTTWMGTYDPSGPLFPAWWGGPSPATKCVEARSVAQSSGHFIPSGPITLVQYTDNVNGFDGDYAC